MTHCTVSGPPIRLDRFLQHWLGGHVGRRRIAAMVAAGEVRVNARRARKGHVVRAGDEITVGTLPSVEPGLVPSPMPLSIVHCDPTLVAVDKPPGVPSTGGAAGPSIAGALLARFPEMAAIDPLRGAGLVHRLDTGTSGLLLAARDPATHAYLRDAFTRKRVRKEYLAIVRGTVAGEGRVDRPLRRRPGTRGRMEPARTARRAWRAVTEYTPVRAGRDVSLLRLRMRTGVTHQLRAHMASIGHPVLGDTRYGPACDPGAALPFTGHCLHAWRLEFEARELPRISTAFPSHWRELCERFGWEPL